MGWIHLQHTHIAVAFDCWNVLVFLGYKHLKHELSRHVHVHAKILSSHIARLIEVGRGKNKVNH